ncbi:hypothetical protein DFY52_21000 [Escherichia coli]|nr:hypothetical protein [Escherichia coli]EFH9418367.1 hypothetical protein [Escherichia coli]
MSLKRMVNLTTRCTQRGRNNPSILTAAPFRGVPQPEAHRRRCQWYTTKGGMTSLCASVLCPDFSGIYPFSKLPVPDAHPCPAHALHLTRGELLN